MGVSHGCSTWKCHPRRRTRHRTQVLLGFRYAQRQRYRKIRSEAAVIEVQSGGYGQTLGYPPPSRSVLIQQMAQYELVASLVVVHISGATGTTVRLAKPTSRRRIPETRSMLEVSQFNALWGGTPRYMRYMIRRLDLSGCADLQSCSFPVGSSIRYLRVLAIGDNHRNPHLVWFGGYRGCMGLIWTLSNPLFFSSTARVLFGGALARGGTDPGT